MAKQPGQGGSDLKEFGFRLNPSFKYKGMYPDVDPGAIPPDGWRLLINTRRADDGFRTRGGLSMLNSADPLQSASSVVYGGVWFEPVPHRAYFLLNRMNCSSIYPYGHILGWFDMDQDPYAVAGTYYTQASQRTCMSKYGSDLYIGEQNNLRKVNVIRFDTTAANQALTLDIPEQLFTSFAYITWMAEFDGYLFIGLSTGTPGASAIKSYDGLTFIDELTALNDVTGAVSTYDYLIMGYAGAPNHIRVRSQGSPPGSWATVAPGAGTVAIYGNGVSYKGVAYWVTGTDGVIWSYTPSTGVVAAAHTVAGATFSCITVFNNLLYAGDSTSGNNGRILMFDGTVWTDAHKALGTDFLVYSLTAFKEDLVAGVVYGSNDRCRFYKSPGKTTNGVYSELNIASDSFATSRYGRPIQLLVL